jgi:hypothetical protein
LFDCPQSEHVSHRVSHAALAAAAVAVVAGWTHGLADIGRNL